jgi:preprotein translocase subunit YajC
VILEVAPDVHVRFLKRAIMEVITPGEAPEEPEGFAEDEHDGTEDAAEHVDSAEDGLTNSHDEEHLATAENTD